MHVCDDLACRLGRRRPVRRARADRRPAEHGRGRRRRVLGAQPVPRHVRTCPGGPGPARGRRGGRRVRSRDRDAGPEPAHRRHARGGVRAAERPGGRVRAPDVGRRCPVRPAAAAARRRGGPELDRRLPGARRVRGAAARSRARAGGHDPRDHGRQADGPRRRGVPDRGEVEGGRRAARAPALLHLQRRRIRARHVQGPGRDGAGSVRGGRGAHDRRVRHGMRARLHLHPRRVPAGDGPPGARDRRGAPARVPRRRRDGGGVRVRHRAPSRRRRVHLRRGDRAVQLDRGQARRTTQQAAVPGAARACSASRPASTTSRR